MTLKTTNFNLDEDLSELLRTGEGPAPEGDLTGEPGGWTMEEESEDDGQNDSGSDDQDDEDEE